MTMKHFRRLTFLLSFIFILTVGGVAAMAANNGPCEDEEWSFAYVEFYNPDNNEAIYVYSFRTPQAGTTTSAKGAVYDKSTNTLTLTNCNLPDYRVVTNMMGDDFKIKLVGTSHVSALYAWGDGYGGSVEIVGDGKLYVNEKQKSTDAIVLQPEGTRSYFKISGNAEVHAFAGKTDGNLVLAMNTTVADCFAVNGLTGLQKTQATRMNYEQIQSIEIDLSGEGDICQVYKKADDKKLYTVTEGVCTEYNPDGTIKAENVRIYTEYELMSIPGNDGKYYMHELKTTEGTFNAEECGYTDTQESVAGYSFRSSSPAYVYIEEKTGDKCVFLYNSIDNNYKDYAYFKYDIAGVLGDVTDKYGNVSSYCMVEKSEDNVSFTRDQYYSNEYMLSQGYKVSGELEYIQNTYVVYSNAASGVLTAKTTVCKHATKVNTVTTKATMSKAGVITTTCKSCGKKLSTSRISKVSTIKLNTASYVYNGKVRTPAVTVKDAAGNILTKNKDYKATYSAGRKNVGKYSVKVTLCGNKYKDSKTMYFTINPKGTTIAATASGKGSMTVRWNKQMTQTTGYQLQYCANKNFRSGTKVKTVSKNKTIRTSVKKLARRKTYYVRVRTYKTVKINGKSVTFYSAWSKAKSVKVK